MIFIAFLIGAASSRFWWKGFASAVILGAIVTAIKMRAEANTGRSVEVSAILVALAFNVGFCALASAAGFKIRMLIERLRRGKT